LTSAGLSGVADAVGVIVIVRVTERDGSGAASVSRWLDGPLPADTSFAEALAYTSVATDRAALLYDSPLIVTA
jgi:hypothetical protein